MRKLFTLLALGAAALSASAVVLPVTGIDTDKYTLTPEGKQMVSTMQAKIAAGVDITEGQKKIIKKNFSDNVYEWELVVATSSSNWYEVLEMSDGTRPTFAEFPYYWVNYVLFAKRKADGTRVTEIQIPLLWPTYFIWEQSKEALAKGENPFDAIKPEDRDLSLVTSTELFEATPAMQLGSGFIYSGGEAPFYGDNTNTWLGWFPMAPNKWYSQTEGWPQKYNNAETWLKDGDQTKYSEIDFVSWDAEERTYTLENTLFFDNNTTLNLRYVGEARMAGFVKEHYEVPFLTAPHIVYVGEEDGKTLDLDNMYDTSDWGPFTKFFILGGTNTCYSGVKSGKTVFDQDWSTAMGVAIPEESQDDPYGFYAGYLFKPAGTPATDPYDWWNMKEPVIETNDKGSYKSNDMVPRLNQIIPAGYNDSYMPWADTQKGDCFYLVSDGYIAFLQEYTRFCVGDKKEGIFLYGTDNYGNTYHGSYAGNIVLHTNPDDLTVTQEIPAIWNIDAVEGVAADTDVKIYNNNEVITIIAGEDVTASVYTISGALVKKADIKAGDALNVEVGNGIYVVKAGNAVKKVVL